ncbi:MAG: hypothetical protein OXU66_04655 [Gammaproteobacteria bacterium]|nr:hypothetical protein [Gammaproteobacteria bacterium]MDD9895139.1 hypothetical protein [Gammaproteobacteria bacterium]MDD9958213.1 hypothetical protein [Gammaproteobacteria bacterium]
MSEFSRLTEANPSLWHSNPVLVQMLGLSPVLAISTSLVLGLALSVLTALVFTLAGILLFFLQPLVKKSWQIYLHLLVLAMVTTLFDVILQIYWYQLYRDLGIYLPLICCNVILLLQLNKTQTLSSLSSFIGISANSMGGFILAMIILSALREFIGNGSLFNNWQLLVPASMEILPNETGGKMLDFALLQPGALLLLGLLLAGINWLNQNFSKAETEELIEPVERARVTGKI